MEPFGFFEFKFMSAILFFMISKFCSASTTTLLLSYLTLMDLSYFPSGVITTTSKQAQLIAVAIISASVVVAAVTSQNLQKVMAQEVYPSGTSTTATTNEYKTVAASSSTTAASVKVVNPNQLTNKEFWINTVHLDGTTNINASVKCDTRPQNTPLHPPEQPAVNSTIPAGGGFRIVEPNKVGAWDFRSFTFAPAINSLSIS